MNVNFLGGFVGYIGLKYVFTPKTMFGDYTNYIGKQLVNSDHVAARASYLGLTFNIGISSFGPSSLKPVKSKFEPLTKSKVHKPDEIVYKPVLADTVAKVRLPKIASPRGKADTLKPAVVRVKGPLKPDSTKAKIVGGKGH